MPRRDSFPVKEELVCWHGGHESICEDEMGVHGVDRDSLVAEDDIGGEIPIQSACAYGENPWRYVRDRGVIGARVAGGADDGDTLLHGVERPDV